MALCARPSFTSRWYTEGMKILVTGGAGYIGSHTIVELIHKGHEVVVIDDLSNSSLEALKRVEAITGKAIPFVQGDVCDREVLRRLLDEHAGIEAAIHFAGKKAVGESVAYPLMYYRNNIDSSISLVDVMLERGIYNLIFSSSATVYGEPQELPLKETSRVGQGLSSPYGQTKYMIEQILRDVAHAHPDFAVTCLRYFNPVGAHESGDIGEDPQGTPNNLLPFIAQVAVGRQPRLRVFGDDYDTPDGTAIRDYIHVVDVAKGHVAALEYMKPGWDVFNLGAGRGVSVFEMIHAFEQASGRDITYEVTARRPGDLAVCYADVSKANRELGWKTEKTLFDACADSWRWQSKNPTGY